MFHKWKIIDITFQSMFDYIWIKFTKFFSILLLRVCIEGDLFVLFNSKPDKSNKKFGDLINDIVLYIDFILFSLTCSLSEIPVSTLASMNS